jgi:WD40 repeat protein
MSIVRAVPWSTALLLGPMLLSLCGVSTAAEPKLSDVIAKTFKSPSGTKQETLTFRAGVEALRLRGTMMAASLSHDGTLLVTGRGHAYSAGQAELWSVAERRRLFGVSFPRGVKAVAMVPDGQHFVAGSYEGIARLYSCSDRRLVREFRGHPDGIVSVAVSPDGQLLATGGTNGTVLLWSLENGKELRSLPGMEREVASLAFSPTSDLIAAGGGDQVIRLWTPSDGKLVRELRGPTMTITAVAFSPDGRAVAGSSFDRFIWLWSLETGAVTAQIGPLGERVASLAFGPDSDRLWCSEFDGSLSQWDLTNQKVLHKGIASRGGTIQVAVSPDGAQIATSSWEGNPRIWTRDLSEGEPLGSDDLTRLDHAQSIVWDADDRGFATLDSAGEIRWNNLQAGVDERLTVVKPAVTALTSGVRGRIVLSRQDGALMIWTPGAKEEPEVLGRMPSPATQLSSADDGTIASLDMEHCVRIHRPGQPDPAPFEAARTAQAVAISPDGKSLLVGRTTGEIELFDVASQKQLAPAVPTGSAIAHIRSAGIGAPALCLTENGTAFLVRFSPPGQPAQVIRIPEESVTAISLSRDGTLAVTGGQSGRVRTWDQQGKPGPSIPPRHKRDVTVVALSPTKMRLVTADVAGEGWMFSADQSRQVISPIAALPPHEKGARNVQFAGGGKWIVTDGLDARTRVTSLETGKPTATFGPFPGNTAFAVTRDGLRLAFGDSSKKIKIVDLLTGKVILEIANLPLPPYCLAFSPDQQRVVGAFRNQGVRAFSLEHPDALPVVVPPDVELPFVWAEFSPDGRQFVTCTGDYNKADIPGAVRLHDAESNKVQQTLVGQTAEVKTASFDSDGTRLATTCKDRAIRIYSLPAAALTQTLKTDEIPYGVTFVPRSDLMLSGDSKGAVSVWNLKTGQIVQRVTCHTDLVTRMTLSPDLSTLATCSRDGTVHLWKMSGDKDNLVIATSAD